VQKPVMLIVGDPFQRIFGFQGATSDFLVDPSKYFGQHCRSPTFEIHHMSICWRITHEMAKFINKHLNPCNLGLSLTEEQMPWWEANKNHIAAWWGPGIRANPKREPAPNSIKIVRGWGTREIVDLTEEMFRTYGNDEVALIAYSATGERTPIRAIVSWASVVMKTGWCWLVMPTRARKCFVESAWRQQFTV
jgi:hypothetical protein